MSVGKRLGKLRRDKGYSQEYVAQKLDVSRQAVSKWETDTSAPDTYNLIALAELFDVTVDYIATGKPDDLYETQITENRERKGISTQKIIGFVLLGAGLLSLILGILLSEVLVLLSIYLTVGGIIFIAVRKRAWFIAMWSLLGITLLMISFLTSLNLFAIFNPNYFQGGASAAGIISVIAWIWLTVAILITVIMGIRRRKSN